MTSTSVLDDCNASFWSHGHTTKHSVWNRFDGGIFGPSKNHLIVVVMSAKRRGQEVL